MFSRTYTYAERLALEGGARFANSIGSFSETGEAVTGVVREQISSKERTL
jgi:hypothetical protein